MLPQWSVVGFSGHRELPNSKLVAVQIEAALDRLAGLCGPLAAVSSVACGADMLFLDAVLQRKLPLWVVLPFPRERVERMFSDAELQIVRRLFQSALQVEVLQAAATDDEAYMEAGENIVEQADVILAVWDGQSAAGLGGTADVVALARKLEKPIIWINPQSGYVREERLDHLSPKLGMNAECTPRETAETHFRELDKAARGNAPAARYLVQQIIRLNLFASAIGLVPPVFALLGKAGMDYLVYFFAGTELCMLGTAFFMAVAHHRRHHEWMRSRIEAEICRSFLGTWQIRRRTGHPFKLAVPGFEQMCKNMRLLQSLDVSPALPLGDARENYSEQRLQNQIEYFQEQAEAASNTHRRLKFTALACTLAAGLLVVADMGFILCHVYGLLEEIACFFSLVLPLAGASLFSLILTMEYSRRAARYQEMKVFLEDKSKRLKMAQTWNGLIRIAIETEEQLIREIIEWQAYSRFVTGSH